MLDQVFRRLSYRDAIALAGANRALRAAWLADCGWSSKRVAAMAQDLVPRDCSNLTIRLIDEASTLRKVHLLQAAVGLVDRLCLRTVWPRWRQQEGPFRLEIHLDASSFRKLAALVHWRMGSYLVAVCAAVLGVRIFPRI